MTANSGEARASVIVPATTANLGCAFDCAGIALSLYLRASAVTQAEQSGFDVVYSGPGASQVPRDESNLLVQSLRRAAAHCGGALPGARVVVESQIPLGVGLGSSAAAIIAGILLGAELRQTRLDPADVLRLALQFEGHADNVAAAVHGGMTLAAVMETLERVLIAKAEVSLDLDFVAVIPDVPLPTEKARAVLPPQYSRQDVVANLQRAALLAAAFFSSRGELSPELFRDRLHQPYRAPLVPGIAQCLEFRHDGALGIFLSGAGSAVMAIARHSARQIGAALVEEFRRQGAGAQALFLKADNRGAQLAGSDSA